MNEITKYDQNEAAFHRMEPEVRPSQEPDGNFLAESFRKKLDSAFALIPEPLRVALDDHMDDYELDELDAVLECIEEVGVCKDVWPVGEGENAGQRVYFVRFSKDEIERAWVFIKCYRESSLLLEWANDAADELLNPAIDEVQQCN
jgi:hypothetical protein